MLVLTNERVIHQVTLRNAEGPVTIKFRSFEGDERDKYDTALSLITGTPEYAEKYQQLMRDTAMQLLVGWEGVVSPVVEEVNGEKVNKMEPVPFTPENLRSFVYSPEAEVYWYTALRRYISPLVLEGADAFIPKEVTQNPGFLPKN